ncbi:MAG: tetratricopeptide repeat protein [Bacteroidota bacterium]
MFQQNTYAQNIDSLKNVLRHATVDTTKTRILNKLGRVYYEQGNYPEALIYHKEALKLSKLTGDKVSMAGGYNNIGMINEAQGNYTEAIQMLVASLKIWEELKNETRVTATYINLAIIYMDHKNYNDALNTLNKALVLSKKAGNEIYLSYTYNTLGLVYYFQKKFDKALETHLMALNIREQLGDKASISDSYSNIGIVYYDLGSDLKKQEKMDSARRCFEMALINYNAARKLINEVGNMHSVASININMGSLSIELEAYADAKNYLLTGLDLCKQTGSKEGIMEACNGLAQVSGILKNPKDEFMYYRQYIAYRDSLTNEENIKKITQTQMQYEFDKKEEAAKLEQEKRELISRNESKKQKIVLGSMSGVLLLVVTFSMVAYRSYKQKQKANEALIEQKEIIEEKQTEILDSIRYAKRIQTALLTSEWYIGRNLNRLNKN